MHSHEFTMMRKQGSVLVSVMLMGFIMLSMALFIFTSELQASRNNESLLNSMQKNAVAQSCQHFLIDSVVEDAEEHCETASEECISQYLGQLKGGFMKECGGFKLAYDAKNQEFTIENEPEGGIVTVKHYVMKCANVTKHENNVKCEGKKIVMLEGVTEFNRK